MRIVRFPIKALARGWIVGLLPLLASCINMDAPAGAKGGGVPPAATPRPASPPAVAAPPIKYSGRKVFTDYGCFVCHGEGRQGTQYGPPLTRLTDHWTREELRKFLKDAIGYAKDAPRINQLANRYRMPMRRFETMSEAEREAVMDHLLGE